MYLMNSDLMVTVSTSFVISVIVWCIVFVANPLTLWYSCRIFLVVQDQRPLPLIEWSCRLLRVYIFWRIFL